MTQSGLGIETGTGLLSAATNETGYATTTEEVLTVGTADLVIDIDFTDADGTDQETIQVTFASAVGSYSLQDIADAINLVSNNPTQQYDEDGRFLGYSAASIVEAGEDNYKLEISARDTDIDGMTIVEAGTGNAVITGIFGTVATAAYDIMTDVDPDTFQEWDEATSAWVVDTDGFANVGVNILTTDAANTAMDAITAAIIVKDTARAAFGYKMNRLEYTVAVINIQAENMMAAESRISDVDVATEMSAMTRFQVLAQAGVAMLSQANMMPQMALSLLR
jgi:flagellin